MYPLSRPKASPAPLRHRASAWTDRQSSAASMTVQTRLLMSSSKCSVSLALVVLSGTGSSLDSDDARRRRTASHSLVASFARRTKSDGQERSGRLNSVSVGPASGRTWDCDASVLVRRYDSGDGLLELCFRCGGGDVEDCRR